jgi:hypothetical protein
MTGNSQSKTGNLQLEIGNSQSLRPASVTWLALGVLIFSGVHLLRLVQAVQQWEFLSELLQISPFYLALTGLLWGAAGILAAWGLWQGKGWAPGFTRLLVLAFLVYSWLDRLLLAGQRTNWPFAVAASLIVLLLIFWILSRHKARTFFEAHRESR